MTYIRISRFCIPLAIGIIVGAAGTQNFASAQTAETLAAQYNLDAMEQALQTRQHYDLYGIHFETDKATIQPDTKPLLDDIALALNNFPDWRLRIVGHTDATGDAAHNEALSLERANAIKAALVERGIDALKVDTAGAGQSQPVAGNDTSEGRALNRRVELVRFNDSPEAKKLLMAMSKYLAAQSAISFGYDATLEVVTHDDQKLGLASSGTVTLNRPDKIRATRSGGFADIEMLFDGKTLTLLGKTVNAYMQVDAPGTLDNLVDQLRDKYNRPLPAADLLMSNVSDELMLDVEDSKDLGSGVIDGVECDFVAFRKKEVDLQIWIAQGDRPYPCRYVVTSRLVPDGPQYTIQVRDWRSGDDVAKDDFAFANATNAQKIDAADVKDKLSDLPKNFTMGDGK
jgi:hypothetical protein